MRWTACAAQGELHLSTKPAGVSAPHFNVASRQSFFPRRVKSEFLTQIEGLSSSKQESDEDSPTKSNVVMVLAATNFPWDLDEAMRRRLEKRIYIPLPDETTRRQLFEISVADVEVDGTVDVNALAKATEGYSGADISNICRCRHSSRCSAVYMCALSLSC